MIILVDYNLNGYVVLLQGTLVSGGWIDLLSIEFVTLKGIGLASDTDDRTIWRFAQSNQMLLLTANRNAKGKDSLEQTMAEEGMPTSLPVLTIANLDRFIERDYREKCGARIVEIMLDLDNYLGVSRVFIP